MTIKGNYQQLFEMRADLTRQAQQSIVFKILHQKNINFFFEYNKMELQRAERQDKALVAKYVQHNAEGQPQIESIDNGRVKYKFIDADAKENFAREYQEMLQTKCTIGI